MSEHDEAELLAVAREAAQAGAAELMPRFGRRPRGVRVKSGPTDLVSEADVQAEVAVRSVLADRRPGEEVVGEEGGSASGGFGASLAGADAGPSPGGADPGPSVAGADAGPSLGGADPDALRWVVDPLDGTVNFLFGIPLFVVSVACQDAVGSVAGVVLDPIREECFEATRGGDAMLGDELLEASSRDELATAMVATGFAYDATRRTRQAQVVARVLPRVRDIRRCGAAALDLAWSACGRFDAYYERGLHPWDLAAGELIAARAGLIVRELPARGEDPAGVVVAPGALIDELYELVDGG